MDGFIAKLKAYCESKGTSPHKVAQEVGESTSFMSDFVTGKRTPTQKKMLEFLENLAKSETLGVDKETLIGWWLMDIGGEGAIKAAYQELLKS